MVPDIELPAQSRWRIVDPRNPAFDSGRRIPTREMAEAEIAAWLVRCDRGGRPDLKRADLEKLYVEEAP